MALGVMLLVAATIDTPIALRIFYLVEGPLLIFAWWRLGKRARG